MRFKYVIFVTAKATETRHFGGVFMICWISMTYAASIGVCVNSLFAYLSKSAAGCWKLGGKKHSKPYKRSSTCLATQAARTALAPHTGRI
jgi:hypothetical protein